MGMRRRPVLQTASPLVRARKPGQSSFSVHTRLLCVCLCLVLDSFLSHDSFEPDCCHHQPSLSLCMSAEVNISDFSPDCSMLSYQLDVSDLVFFFFFTSPVCSEHQGRVGESGPLC